MCCGWDGGVGGGGGWWWSWLEVGILQVKSLNFTGGVGGFGLMEGGGGGWCAGVWCLRELLLIFFLVE